MFLRISFLSVFLFFSASNFSCICNENKIDHSSNDSIKKIQNYMDGISVFIVDFDQTKILKNGKVSTDQGTMFLKKENNSCKIRFDFKENPETIFVIDKTMIMKGKDQKNRISNLNSVPVAHIFDKNLNLEKYFIIEQTGLEKYEKILFVDLKPKFNKSVSVKLFFKTYENGNIERFLGWSIKDHNGTVVNVAFDEISMIVNDVNAIPNNIFNVNIKKP